MQLCLWTLRFAIAQVTNNLLTACFLREALGVFVETTRDWIGLFHKRWFNEALHEVQAWQGTLRVGHRSENVIG